jgi:hypothetical protein
MPVLGADVALLRAVGRGPALGADELAPGFFVQARRSGRRGAALGARRHFEREPAPPRV